MPSPVLERSILLAPDLVARRAAPFAPDAQGRWMLQMPRRVRSSFAREALHRGDVAEQVWMLRQPGWVREAFIAEVLQAPA